MVAFFRQFLVVLLVLLQNAAPLVHAHTGDDFPGPHGIHLHEFEILRATGEHLAKSTANYSHDCQSYVVMVGSAIKPQQTALFCPLPIWETAGLTVLIHSRIIDFLPHIADFTIAAITNHNSSRAPPPFFC